MTGKNCSTFYPRMQCMAKVSEMYVRHRGTAHKFSESVFGFMDQLVRSKPNISTLSAEAYVMFANNKTNAWLEEKDASTQQAILKAASLDVRRVRASFKKRQDEIATARRVKVQRVAEIGHKTQNLGTY